MPCQGSNLLKPSNGVDVHESSFTVNNVKVVLHFSFSSATQSNSTENVIYRVAISKRLCDKKQILIFGLALNNSNSPTQQQKQQKHPLKNPTPPQKDKTYHKHFIIKTGV